MPQIYLHIGFHKTGTTALQRQFDKRRLHLAEANVIYPESMLDFKGHHEVVFAISGEINQIHEKKLRSLGYRGQLEALPGFDEIKTYYDNVFSKTPNNQKVVISSEAFAHITSKVEIDRFKEFFEGYPMKCVAYVRDAKSYLASRYIHHVDTKAEQRPFRRFVRQMLWECDFVTRLQPYADIFGQENVIVRPYNGDTVADFLVNVLKADFTLPDPKRRIHRGMHVWLKELAIRIHNSDLDAADKKALFVMLRQDVSNALPEVDREAFLWEAPIVEKFQPQFDAYAQTLYDEYGVDLREIRT